MPEARNAGWAEELIIREDASTVAKEIERARGDYQWFREHLDELRAAHAERFVAISRRNLIATAGSIDQLETAIRAAGVDPSECVIELVTSEDYLWVI